MPQSLASLHTHLIFSTKHRQRYLRDDIRDSTHRYMAVVLQNFGCPAMIINSVEDHVHLLFELSRTAAVSQVVEEVKTSSSQWIKKQGPNFSTFSWQTGYAAFSVSRSNLPRVREYIADQHSITKKSPFKRNIGPFCGDTGLPSMNDMFGIDRL